MNELIGILIGLPCVVAWVLTLRDIWRSDFRNDSKNTRSWWFAIVLFTGFIGMAIYYLVGIRMKEKRQFRFLRK